VFVTPFWYSNFFWQTRHWIATRPHHFHLYGPGWSENLSAYRTQKGYSPQRSNNQGIGRLAMLCSRDHLFLWSLKHQANPFSYYYAQSCKQWRWRPSNKFYKIISEQREVQRREGTTESEKNFIFLNYKKQIYQSHPVPILLDDKNYNSNNTKDYRHR